MTAGAGEPLARSEEHERVAEALLAGRERATILSAMSPCQPDDLLAALLRTGRRRGIQLTLLIADISGRFGFAQERDRRDLIDGALSIVALAGATPRHISPYVDHSPHSMFDLDRYIADGTIAADIFVTRVSPPRRAGSGFGLGPMIGYAPAALSRIGCVGAEIVPGMRSFAGTAPVPPGLLDAVCHAIGHPRPSGAGRSPATRGQERIGELVAQLIPDGATVQLGLGTVPEAVAGRLAGKRSLGLHSGILPASLRPLIAAGMFTGEAKSDHRGLHIATGVLDGTLGERWDERVRLKPISVSHAPGVLRRQHRLWAINSAFEIDLLGQANAEYAGQLRVASGGGQSDFVRAAHQCAGGASVFALPSRTAAGQARIVPRLGHPGVPTSSAGDVDYVVTEHGVAQLTGATASMRAERLIGIAHPDDRPALRRAAG
jgi:acyl CoA:acetate/3-ketoacid CoA transferase beta subunit